MTDDTGAALWTDAEKDRNGNAPANVADGLFAIARALDRLASATYALGNGNAATSMGAIEAFGLHIGERLDRIAGALEEREVR